MKKEALRRFESLPRELSAPMTRCLRALLRALAMVLVIPALAAWDPAGHRTVAEIAWEYMTLRARERAVALLMHGPAQADFASLRPGGSTVRVAGGENRDACWDGILDRASARGPGEGSIAYATRVAHRVERIHPRASLATAAASTDVVGWEREGLHLAQTVVYAGVTRGAPPSATYQAQALTVAERRVALAGYRLAALLNDALK